jgi:phosphohistidine phosphatase SixA
MEAPGITRHRRPFLAPVWMTLLVAVIFAGIAWGLYRGASTTVVLLVHPPEKAPGNIDDPPVSPEGEARAERLAQMFGDPGGALGVDAIYESDDRRAQQTAAPLAERLHRAPIVFAAPDARAAAARIVREHAGGTVLVVASGAALPQMIEELDGAGRAALSEDPSIMYVVSVPRFGRAHLARFRF